MSRDEWVKTVEPRLRELGWWGDVRDASITGTDRLVRVNARRLKLIFDTNMRSRRATALWQRIQASKKLMPWLVYKSRDDARVRPEHRGWHNTVLPVDHPWWQTHFPPNGWNCRCTVVQMSDGMLARAKLKPSAGPPDDGPPRRFRNRATGEVSEVPRGIDPGWAYAPGRDYFEGLKPAPLDGPISRPALNARGPDGPLTPLPPPRNVPEGALLPREMSDEDAVAVFKEAFEGVSAEIDGVLVFRDKLGEPLVISNDFFQVRGVTKLTGDRREAINLLAWTVQEPDEIWWVWERVKDNRVKGGLRYRLTRRYVARFNVEREERAVVAVMEVSKEGWRGVTAFPSKDPGYADAEQVRGGVLAWRRE